jgi:type I restriction enzyme S subunit
VPHKKDFHCYPSRKKTTAMLEKKLVPKLRFAEFGDKLNNIVLDKITSKISDGIHSTPKYDINGGYYFVNGNNLVDGVIVINNSTKKVSITEYEKHKRPLDDNSILLSINGTIGNIALYKHEKIVLGKSACYINLDKTLPVSFYYYIFQTPRVKKYFLSELTGSTIMNLSLRTIKATELITPSLPEQQKIASFLTEVDTKLSQLTKKKALLEDYKKGVMQKIFSQELRFKDGNGNDYGDWEEKKLGEVGTFQTSSVDKLSKQDEQEVYLVNYMNVYRHETISNITVKSYQVVTANKNQVKSSNLSKGDILFTPSSETPTDIGHSVVIFEDISDALYSYHLIRFRPKIKLDLMFSHYFCNTSEVLRQLSRFSTGSTRFTISIGNFSKVGVSYPCIEEQTKIASFLSDLDIKIEVLSTSIKNTQTFKKGLLQQLFV